MRRAPGENRGLLGGAALKKAGLTVSLLRAPGLYSASFWGALEASRF
jgi:hypothetical protein